jgi:hypothetical protein
MEQSEIKVGVTWIRAELKPNPLARVNGDMQVKNIRAVKIVAVETNHICIEEIMLPASPEYGHPQRWVPRGAFIGDHLLEGKP